MVGFPPPWGASSRDILRMTHVVKSDPSYVYAIPFLLTVINMTRTAITMMIITITTKGALDRRPALARLLPANGAHSSRMQENWRARRASRLRFLVRERQICEHDRAEWNQVYWTLGGADGKHGGQDQFEEDRQRCTVFCDSRF